MRELESEKLITTKREHSKT